MTSDVSAGSTMLPMLFLNVAREFMNICICPGNVSPWRLAEPPVSLLTSASINFWAFSNFSACHVPSLATF